MANQPNSTYDRELARECSSYHDQHLTFFLSLLVCTRGLSALEKTKEQNEEDMGNETDEEDDDKEKELEFLERVESIAKQFAAFVFAPVGASVLYLLYVVGTIFLWGVGFVGIFKWVISTWKKRDRNNNIPEAMPGQELGEHWERAWELASLRNHGVREDRGQAHFNVVPFLKSQTGLDMQHLMRLAKARDAKSKSEQELIAVDRMLPDARIDLEYLSDMIKERANPKTEGGPSSTGNGDGHDGGGGVGAAATCIAETADATASSEGGGSGTTNCCCFNDDASAEHDGAGGNGSGGEVKADERPGRGTPPSPMPRGNPATPPPRGPAWDGDSTGEVKIPTDDNTTDGDGK